MESEEALEKPAWMLYFDGAFYDNYLNDLRRLNISKVHANAADENNKKRPSILKRTPSTFESNNYIHNGIKEIQNLSESELQWRKRRTISDSELQWRKRRTNGIVIIAILLIAGIATATALVMHLVFIEGKDPFEIPELPSDSVHRRRYTTTVLPILTAPAEKRHKDEHSQGANVEVTTTSTKSPPVDEILDFIGETLSENLNNTKTTHSDRFLSNKTENKQVVETKNQKASTGSSVNENNLHPITSMDENLQSTQSISTTDSVDVETTENTVRTSTDLTPMLSTTLNNQYEKSDSTTLSSINDKNDSTTLSHLYDKTDDVIMTQSTENKTTTVKPKSLTTKGQIVGEEDFNFIILDKAGTTLDVDSGTVISAADSPHTVNNTDVIITAEMKDPNEQSRAEIVPENSTISDDPEIYCKHYPKDLMVDPTNCARYYNCSDSSIKQGLGEKYLSECKYPRLFKNLKTGCILFLNVTCADRYEPKAPCEYVENMCFGDVCEPCEKKFPSCVGRENGTIEYSKETDGGTNYIACFKERTVGQFTCRSGEYDEKLKKCV